MIHDVFDHSGVTLIYFGSYSAIYYAPLSVVHSIPVLSNAWCLPLNINLNNFS